jgi:hypothetical protein
MLGLDYIIEDNKMIIFSSIASFGLIEISIIVYQNISECKNLEERR